MKILVAVKRALDYNVKPHIASDGSDVDIKGCKMSVNPFDEIAIEEAVRMKEAGIASELVAVSIGGAKSQDALRAAFAIGIERGILVQTEQEHHHLQSLDVAKILAKIYETEQPQIILLGKQAIDSDANQTGQMLAGMLKLPQATFASAVEIFAEGGQQKANITRETDEGLQMLQVSLPAVITTDLRLNEPRHAKLPDIMKAKAKPITTTSTQELGINLGDNLRLLKMEEPKKRQAGIKLDSAEKFIEILQSKIT